MLSDLRFLTRKLRILNGASTGYLLDTHKGKIGVKRVESIAVWNHPLSNLDFNNGRKDLKLNMLFKFETVANPITGNPQKM